MGQIYHVADQMPIFPGCESTNPIKYREKCAEKKLLSYVYKNIKYPAIARQNGVEGLVIISFVVEENGTVSNAKIAKDIGANCGMEALKVVNLMNERQIRWSPGINEGKPVRVKYNLPVRFKLEID